MSRCWKRPPFPREKVCGDGLTPRAVREIQKLGLPHAVSEGWRRNKGLRLIAGGRTIELPWPEVADFPTYGLIRTRLGFDEDLARHAQSAGAVVLERHSVTSALTAEDGRVIAPGLPSLTSPDARPAKRATSTPTSYSPRTETRHEPRCQWVCTNVTTVRWASRCARTSPRPGTTTTGWKAGWNFPASPVSRCLATVGFLVLATARPTWASAS